MSGLHVCEGLRVREGGSETRGGVSVEGGVWRERVTSSLMYNVKYNITIAFMLLKVIAQGC